MTPHERAAAAAVNAINRLGDLFGLMGDSEIGDGLFELYQLLIDDLQRLDNVAAIRSRLTRFERDVYGLVGEWITIALDIGEELGRKNIDTFALESVLLMSLDVPIVALARDAIKTALAAQSARVLALLAGNADAEFVFGSPTQPGILSAGTVIGEIARWLVNITNNAAETMLTASLNKSGAPSEDWRKQAVATIDDVTTDTCLRVHGQVQPIGQPFQLSGNPWEAAKNYGFSAWVPPFHWYCRTVVIYIPAALADGDKTRMMRAEAARMLASQRDPNAIPA